MRHEGLLQLLTQTEQFNSFLGALKKGRSEQLIHGISSAQKSLWGAATLSKVNAPVVFITADLKEAKDIVSDFSVFLPQESVDCLPPREFLPYGVYAKSNDLQVQRLKVIQKILSGEIRCLVLPVEALTQGMVPKGFLQNARITLNTEEVIDYEAILKKLIEMGYERVDLVQSPSQFSARGGIIDIFSPAEENPFRIEFFDDEIESIRFFDSDNQRSIREISTAEIYPAREILFSEEEKEHAITELEKELKEITKKKLSALALNKLKTVVEEFTSNLEQGIWTEDMDSLQPYLFREQQTILDYFTFSPIVFVSETLRVIDNIENGEKERSQYLVDWFEAGKVLPGFGKFYLSKNDVLTRLRKNSIVHLTSLPRQIPDANLKNIISISGKTLPVMGKLNMLVDEIKSWKRNKYVTVILTSNTGRAERIKENLWENGIEAPYVDDLKGPLLSGGCYIGVGNLQKGFEIPFLKFAVVTDEELYGKQKRSRKVPTRREGSQIRTFADLKVGDYVVHEQNGIGKYLGVEKLEAGGVEKDYLHIQYAGTDKLYLPAEQIDSIQKYIGSEGHAPKLSKLGGTEWTKVKNRVKSSVQEMAKELLNLYAHREMLKGFAFSEDDELQKQFEEEFPYTETPDQLKAIEEVKADMMKPRPMDRLVCGDVGYGKTEVAMRAIFKAVRDSKQVAVLVPTTVLAQQHYQTFTERFQNYPVNIGILSRFQTRKEQSQTIENIKKGLVDIVIGTHRMLSKDIQFNDLGLLVIDEEQRFGVGHKEKLKQLRKNIDVLTLSATPIPRTLHMALAGVRDMSIIETPPENRYPVQTYVVEFSPELVKDAIRKEMDRGGQIYFIHNRIEDMDKVKAQLQTWVPEARIAQAHGRMRENELERIMLEFIEGKYDVLLCTTIVENGLDISNVNTLIVDEADTMGLSQLYQIRGRVGRTNRLAYAYFTYRKDKVLTEVAEKRLAAIREFTEFGSGFKIAMRDLEIRGSGNILGPEQHGQMLAVGFELYCKLLDEEVKKLQGTKVTEDEKQEEVTIELNVNAYISDKYIGDSSLKMEIYRQLAAVTTSDEMQQVEEELIDRFGDPTPEVENLISITRLKVLAAAHNVQSIKHLKGEVLIKFGSDTRIKGETLLALRKHYGRRLNFSASQGLTIKVRTAGLKPRELLETLESIFYRLDEYSSEKLGKH